MNLGGPLNQPHDYRPNAFQKDKRFTPMVFEYRITQEVIKTEDGFYTMTEKIMARVADMKDQATVNAILAWAKYSGATKLLLLDKDSVRKMLEREAPKRVDTGRVCRCGACGELVHAGDCYCCHCGQRVREEETHE